MTKVKTLALALACAIVPVTANAAEPWGELHPIICGYTWPELEKVGQTHGEVPVWQGKTGDRKSTFHLQQHPNGKTWVLLWERPDGLFCHIADGIDGKLSPPPPAG